MMRIIAVLINKYYSYHDDNDSVHDDIDDNDSDSDIDNYESSSW